jgi:predicted Zn-dependent peptidase
MKFEINKIKPIVDASRNLPEVFCIVALMAIQLVSSAALAGEYTPPGLYEVDYYRLPNQMHVLLKERHQARSVSYRVAVNLGMADYPCGRQETPHFLEHLLFTGTSMHTESELDDLIEGHGGNWNAFTGHNQTYYDLDIFSKHADIGLQTLHEIITDSQIRQEDVDNSRDIIHREAGGRPSFFRQWVAELGIETTGSIYAHDLLLEGTPYVCQGLEAADGISRVDILEAYHRYYVPNNMTLVVVGDFNSAEMKKAIESTFGTMEAGETFHRQVSRAEPNTTSLLLTSTLSPLVDDEATVGLAYLSGGLESADYYPRWFIEKYLSDRLYKKIRIEEGLSYSASAYTISYPNTAVWFAYADTELDTIDEVVKLIQDEIDLLVRQPVDLEQLSLVKNKLLMAIVQGYESNAGIADYYLGSLFELERYGTLVRMEDEINELTAADIQRVAVQIFSKASPIEFHNTPTMTYSQLGFGLGILGLVLTVLLVRRFLRYRSNARARRVSKAS